MDDLLEIVVTIGFCLLLVSGGLLLFAWGILYLTGKKEVNNAMRSLRGGFLFSKDKDWRFDRITRLYGVAFSAGGICILLAMPLYLLIGLRAAEIAVAAGVAVMVAAEFYRNFSKRMYW